MDELKRKAPVVKSSAMISSRPRSFDPLRFVAPTAVKSREEAIAELAYFRALNRGFEPGHEVEDWLEAEAEYEKQHRARRLP
jgi:Protein of unknown function (DUF2934)